MQRSSFALGFLLFTMPGACGGVADVGGACCPDAASDGVAPGAPPDGGHGCGTCGPDSGGTDTGAPPSDAGSLACVAPLTDTFDFDTAPIAAWCASNPGRVYESALACDGYLAVAIGEKDCVNEYLFDATTKKLVALTRACNVWPGNCSNGPASFVPPGAHCENGDWKDRSVCAQDAGGE